VFDSFAIEDSQSFDSTQPDMMNRSQGMTIRQQDLSLYVQIFVVYEPVLPF
jgi:hypothetical protein